jgi:Histidine kinase
MQVATELHDGPIQRLAVLSYDLERAKQRMLGNPAAVARVEHAQAALSTEVQGLRELMASLRPPTLDEVGLEAALRDHVGAFAAAPGSTARSGSISTAASASKSATTASASSPWPAPPWSATAASARSPCRNASRWPAAASRSTPAPAPASPSGRCSAAPRAA